MATTTAMTLAAQRLWAIATEARALPETAAGWSEESDDAQMTFQMEWDELMDQLAAVREASARGALAPGEYMAYEETLALLRANLSLVRQLDLSLPSFVDSPPARIRRITGLRSRIAAVLEKQNRLPAFSLRRRDTHLTTRDEVADFNRILAEPHNVPTGRKPR